MIENLIEKEILVDTLFQGELLYYLKAPLTFKFDKLIIDELQENYLKDKEIGGFINFSILEDSEKIVCNAEEVIFVENISPTPEKSYRINTPNHKKAKIEAFEKGLFPFSFHTHPTIGNNPLEEQLKFMNQLNTSLADKYVSYRNVLKIKGQKLILPDILVVDNGYSLGGIFIGFYNGLITPNNFSEEKNKVSEELANKAVDNVTNYWTSADDKAKFLMGLSALAGVGLVYKTRKYSIWILLLIILAVPQIMMTTRERNNYFAITRGRSTEIDIPEISMEEIETNINTFAEIEAEFKTNKTIR